MGQYVHSHVVLQHTLSMHAKSDEVQCASMVMSGLSVTNRLNVALWYSILQSSLLEAIQGLLEPPNGL